MRSNGIFRRVLTTSVVGGLLLAGSPVLTPSPAQAAPGDDPGSELRRGVIALVGAVSAVGQTPELASPLPFTTTSMADLLRLDEKLTTGLQAAMTGTTDLAVALEKVEGITVRPVPPGLPATTIVFDYERAVPAAGQPGAELDLVYDDGDLRLGSSAGAVTATATLRTTTPFMIAVDPQQTDALLRTSLINQPVLQATIDISAPQLPAFEARQGFTELDVTGGRYEIHRTQSFTLRDPDGRGVLTLEDLRYSTLPDLFQVRKTRGELDVRLDVALPSTLGGGQGRTGSLSLTEPAEGSDVVWPTAQDATRTYGAALTQATGLSAVDGITSLAQYTGTVLALQDAADVPFPNLGGGTSDVFAPGDDLLALLSTAATAQIRCGASPDNPPSGTPAPGEAVYCQATTAAGLGAPSNPAWTIAGGTGTVEPSPPPGAVGPEPTRVVKVTGSDGEPDLQLTFTAGGKTMTARTMPHTVQDVVRRIKQLPGSDASASLSTGRLDVAVAITPAAGSEAASADLELGNAGTVGALVGLTGLRSDDDTTAEVSATGARFDVGFGVQTGAVAADSSRQTFLLPSDASLLTIADLTATRPTTVTGLKARIGFLQVKADLTDLTLAKSGTGPVVELERVGTTPTAPLAIGVLLNDQGVLDPAQVRPTSRLTASIGFQATEEPLPGGSLATGGTAAATGTAGVRWGTAGLPSVVYGGDYAKLRVFDPVPAVSLTGTAGVVRGNGDGGTPDDGSDDVADAVTVTVPGADLYTALNVAPPAQGADAPVVARRVVTDSVSCQDVTVTGPTTLSCEGFAPSGTAVWTSGQQVQLIVLGDPFALRDSVIEGLATTLSEFDRTTGDNVVDPPALADQYTSTLPLVGLVPAQLAGERDALRATLEQVAKTATADEQGGGPAGAPHVSSAQELAAAVTRAVTLETYTYSPSLRFTPGSATLGVTLEASVPDTFELDAPLRLDDLGAPAQAGPPAVPAVQGRGQVQSGTTGDKQATVKVGVDSTTVLAIDVNKTTARPSVGTGTRTVSTATLSRTSAQIAGHPLAAGVAALRVLDQASSADLGVTVTTSYAVNGTQGSLRTRRTNARPTGRAAVANLTVGAGDVIRYAADATDSAGGEAAEQPKPDPMQVAFLAEGLDGLASAVGQATDGAAARNLDSDGAPVSAPLIGTDLDAGAGVADILTDLTSQLRTQLSTNEVASKPTAAALKPQLETAFKAAVAGTDGLAALAADGVTVSITCPATPCADDSRTGWDAITIGATLKGVEKESDEAAFDTGLADLEVRSIKKIHTKTSWTLPVTLKLDRGAGPQVVIGTGADQKLSIVVDANLPVVQVDGKDVAKIDAIVGYLPAELTATPGPDSEVHTTVAIKPTAGTYDLFQLYDGELTARPSFEGAAEKGIKLDFVTKPGAGVFNLSGNIDIPWTAARPFKDPVTYNAVKLDVGQVASAVGKPFAVIDPYLAPVRDVVDVLRAPIPVVSDLSELGGAGEVSLLSLLDTLAQATKKPQLELAHRVIGLIGGVTTMISALAPLGQGKVPLEELAEAGALLSIDPSELTLHERCTETVTTTTTSRPPTGPATSVTKKAAPVPCQDDADLAEDKATPGAAGQTTDANRKGNRTTKEKVGTKTVAVTGSLPGFSLPFLTDPDQLIDVLTGEGEASYFRLDLGTLAASVAYKQEFGPIMAGPVPIKPFVGGSISVEGRLAMGFDSFAQTIAARSVNPGDVEALVAKYAAFNGGDVIREGFYIDDLDAEGVDVPEVSVVTTLEAGAGVSIGIVTAGLKGSVTLTIDLDLNDPNGDGRLRTAEIKDLFNNRPDCIFEAEGNIQATISVYVEIELLFTSLEYSFDILDLGPYQLFKFGCPQEVPKLVELEGTTLVLNSGGRNGRRLTGATDGADEYEVRQFAGPGAGTTTYEVSGFGRVQNVQVTENRANGAVTGYTTTIFQSGISTSTVKQGDPVTASSRPTFSADGGELDDTLAFLSGEKYEDVAGIPRLRTTPFDARVSSLRGGAGDDTLTTGAADDNVLVVDGRPETVDPPAIDGGDGDDSIDTGFGDDAATGGAGNDTVTGGAGRDDVLGGDGNDHVAGGPDADRVQGGAGNDDVTGGGGRDVRAVLVQKRDMTEADIKKQVDLGFDSGDVVVGGAGTDSVDGGDGGDVVVGGDGGTLVTKTVGSLFVSGTRTVNVAVQGATPSDATSYVQRDIAIRTAAAPTDLDTQCASGAVQSAATSTDYVTGGAEADVVIGGNGPDTLDGGSGADELCGRAGDDQISGDGAGEEPDSNDVIRGGAGNDRADGGLGDDVLYGDDVDLGTGNNRVLDGTLGLTAKHDGADYLAGGVGDDVIAGGAGSDLLVGDAGDDATYGEGRDTAPVPGLAAPGLDQRLLACNAVTRVVAGLVDLDGDLLGGPGGTGITPDDGRMAGLPVVGGSIRVPGSPTTTFQGLLGDAVVVGGLIDLDGNGSITAADTGIVEMASMLATGANSDGDCILAGDGDDDLRGGAGSDYLGSGAGTDLTVGGDGNDLLLGDDGTDLLLGDAHHDVVVGGLGDDHLVGGGGDDRLRGNEGDDDLVGGSETTRAADGQDVLLGGRGDDVLAAENAVPVSAAISGAVSGASVPWSTAGLLPAEVTAPTASRFASSALRCDGDTGTRYLTLLADDGVAGVPAQSPGTDLAYDELYGGFDCDFVFGSTGNDLVRGGQDDDVVEAGPGQDIAYGDDGSDVVVGGSSVDPAVDTLVTTDRTGGSGQDDLGDRIHGDGGPDGAGGDGADLVAGDNALPVRVETLVSTDTNAPAPYVLTLYDVATRTSSPRAGTAGGDTIDTGRGTDRVLGQGGADTIRGDDGDDYLEGNDGADTITGGTGDDDVLGGSSSAAGRPLGTLADGGTRLADELAGPFDASAAGLLDGGRDTIDGSAGDDVVLGDNGRITRPTSSTRTVARADESGTTGVSDGDRVTGGDGLDRLLGQGGDDVVDGDDDDDHVEGNEGGDTLLGGRDGDTVIGGSSLSPDDRGTLDDAVAAARTQLDGGDTIEGDDPSLPDVASDVIVGDNATVIVASGSSLVQLADVATTTSTPAAGTSGDDVIGGGSPGAGRSGAADRVFGQGGNDTVTTGPADDYLEGGSGFDALYAGDGDDDVLGGSSALDGRPFGDDGARLTSDGGTAPDPAGPRLVDGTDVVDSGDGDDVVLGDNGFVTRPAGASRTRADGTRLRSVLLHDVATATRSMPAGVGGGDVITAGEGRDLVFGQAGDDTTTAGAGDDYVEGNAGNDRVRGDSGEDDVLGGGSSNTGALITVSGSTVTDRLLTPVYIPTDRTAAGMLDGNDTVEGGDARDVLLGDNGRITRDGAGVRLAGGASGVHVVRQVSMADEAPGAWAGSDALSGGPGDDDLYGQLDNTRTTRPKQVYAGQAVQGDVLSGGGGDDAVLGDQGIDRPTPAAALGAVNRTVTDAGRFISELVRPSGTLVRVVALSQTSQGGDDLVLGGDGSDTLHAGRGKDVVNAGSGDDVVFGGDDADALWGGAGHDRIFGGAGTDLLDIKRRTNDVRLWQVVAPVEDTDRRRRTVNGRDVLYGGSGADAMQADQGDAGTTRRVQGDRLIDWSRSINYAKVCQSGYGAGRVLNASSSSMVSTLRALALATGSVGSAELAIPSAERLTTYAGTGSFVCETG